MNKFSSFLKNLLLIIAFFCVSNNVLYSQCFQIEAIFVAACEPSGTGDFEGQNEMFRFRVGPSALNTSNLSINWPSQSWNGLIQNAVTASKVATLNADILAAGGCAQLLQPTAGVLPANVPVIVVTSYLFDTASNSFGALTENTYIIFQNSTTTGGHFGNYAPTGTRTLSMNFGGNACSDTVTYTRNLLSDAPGDTVNFTANGQATYVNNGCSAPVQPFTVDAGSNPASACAGTTVSLSGTAQGQTSVAWTAPEGTFSSSSTLITNYTIPPTATGTITVTLTATNACGATINDTVTITVNAATTPTFTIANSLCNGEAAPALPATSNNGITGTWLPTTVSNTTSGSYVFTPNSGGCTNTFTLNVTVSNGNIIPTFTAVNPICSGETLAALPTTSNNSITGTWSPALNNSATTTYTFTPTAGQCATTQTLTITVNPNVTPTFTAIPAICSGGTLSALPTTSNNSITGTWSPSLNNTATTTYTFTPTAGQCATTQTLTITVNQSVTPTFTAVPAICSGGTLAALPTTSNNSISGTWSPSLNNTATTTYTFTPTAGQCATTQTLTITVNPSVTPTFTAVAPICSGGTLNALPTTSNNSISGTWSPALNNTTTTTYTFTPNAGQCATTQTLTITVNPNVTPTFTTVNPICEGDNLFPLPTTSNNGITGTWTPALDNTTTTTYTFLPNANQCATSTTLTIVVNNAGTVTPITGNDTVCMADTLQLSNATAGGMWSSSNSNAATVDADGLVTPVGPGFSTIIYTTSSICNSASLDITVYLPPNPMLTDQFICVDTATGNTISTVNMQCGVSNADHTFVWTLNGQPLATTTNLHVATEEGLYEVTVTNNTTGCSATASADVIKSSIAIAEATVERDFDNGQTITVTVTGGSGDYLYQLNDNWPQEDNQFIVNQGVYNITVIDKNGCGTTTLSVFALNYPRYFTPNNDGYNDTWFIEGLSNQQAAQIFIFDRYGKLVKAIKPYLNEYWDGTLNGYPLPSTDYWFTLNYLDRNAELKEFRSHFSLKR